MFKNYLFLLLLLIINLFGQPPKTDEIASAYNLLTKAIIDCLPREIKIQFNTVEIMAQTLDPLMISMQKEVSLLREENLPKGTGFYQNEFIAVANEITLVKNILKDNIAMKSTSPYKHIFFNIEVIQDLKEKNEYEARNRTGDGGKNFFKENPAIILFAQNLINLIKNKSVTCILSPGIIQKFEPLMSYIKKESILLQQEVHKGNRIDAHKISDLEFALLIIKNILETSAIFNADFGNNPNYKNMFFNLEMYEERIKDLKL